MKLTATKKLLLALVVLLIAAVGLAANYVGSWVREATLEITDLAERGVDKDGILANRKARTKKSDPKIRFELDPAAVAAGEVKAFLDQSSEPAGSKAVAVGDTGGTIVLTGLTEGREHDVVLKLNGLESTKPFKITLDQTGPVLGEMQPSHEQNGDVILLINFNEDLAPEGDELSAATYFALHGENPIGAYATTEIPLSDKKVEITGSRAELNLGKLPRANYQLTVKPAVKDVLAIAATKQTKTFSVFAPPAPAPPTIEIAGLSKTAAGVMLTNNPGVVLEVRNVPDRPGHLRVYVNGAETEVLSTANLSRPISRNVRLSREGRNTVRVSFTDAENRVTMDSSSIDVVLDSIGPLLQHVELVESPGITGTETTLLATFADDDFVTPLRRSHFAVRRQADNRDFSGTDFAPRTVEVEGRTIRLSSFMSPLPAGEYELEVTGEGAGLRDRAGNPAGRLGQTNVSGENQRAVFSILATRKFGQHVEFPPYAPPKKQTIPEEGFNPGDFVETRVARLYYYRDAHRVAEILNRNIRSYNQAAVTLAERRAEKSRDAADDATDERRQAEREAVRAAQQARNAEQQLFAAREVLNDVQGLQNTIAADKTTFEELKSKRDSLAGPQSPGDRDPNEEERARLSKQLKDLEQSIANDEANLARFGGTEAVDSLKDTVKSMEQSVGNLRQTELVKQEESEQSDAKEARARANQFRDEVSAAKTDPDTYVAGDIHSVDPVTQVSISVIGEGLIQLRGPIKGINKIRTMINQIDSPVGQIKIGIFTVQVNGEEGDKMEKVIGDAEGYIDLSRFLVNQSLQLLRRSIQSEAAMIAAQCEAEGGHYQVDRDRRYLYGFFGRDFIDELYAMDSEFLKSENKLLSLHAMDTVGLNRALFILALAKNDVRERIICSFLESAKTDLADAEYDFRRSSELKPHRTQKKVPPWNRARLPVWNKPKTEEIVYEAVHRNAMQRYHFRNLSSFFDVGFVHPDTMNPMQREFIRLAQIFKAQLIAEMELKQRVMERGLIEERSNDENARFAVMRRVNSKALEQLQSAFEAMLESQARLLESSQVLSNIRTALNEVPEPEEWKALTAELAEAINRVTEAYRTSNRDPSVFSAFYQGEWLKQEALISHFTNSTWLSAEDRKVLAETLRDMQSKRVRLAAPGITKLIAAYERISRRKATWEAISGGFLAFWQLVEQREQRGQELQMLSTSYNTLVNLAQSVRDTEDGEYILGVVPQVFQAKRAAMTAQSSVRAAEDLLNATRGKLDHRKLLNLLIDEQEDKFIELVEGTRSHLAVMDNYLKRLSIALEDDFKVQFYDPAFVGVREAARSREVNLGQVERTTILTNNRAFAKVDPQATMEFDLPKRQIAIKEAFDAAKALVEDTGALVNDPTFLAAFQMMGGSKQPTTVKNLVPGQSMSTDQQTMGLAPQQPESGVPGSALQSLVPEPAIYKLETGTGFQIRPVMQPDGDSVVYDFDYMYTTNIREPVRADEKHLGRIKRHLVHTAVQTGNYELREISRYQVALKVSRTSRGVPLLEDIPGIGAAFRPAASDESSIQQNIILGQTNVYPTLFDLMGLRWAQQVVDLDHTSLLESEHVIRGRQQAIRDYVFDNASKRVDEFLNIQCETPEHYRPDFYHRQTLPSPYHPSGYVYPGGVLDPTGNNFERFDRRPSEMQEPPYESYRHHPVYPERIQPQPTPERIPSERLPEQIEIRGAMSMLEQSRLRDGSLSTPRVYRGVESHINLMQTRDRAVVPAGLQQDTPVRRLPPVR